MTSLSVIVLGLGALTMVLYRACTAYLNFSKRIRVPLDARNHMAIGIAWLFFAVLICAIGVGGVKLVVTLRPDLNRSIGVLPVALAAIFSFVCKRSDWREFYSKFQNR